MSDIVLNPITKVPNAKLDLPGSKSIANRVLLLAALADGVSLIHNVPDVSEDVVLMLKALVQLGIKIEKIDNSTTTKSSYKIFGCNGNVQVKNYSIFCGNSGTTIRFLTASLALMQGSYELTGVNRMKERPISDLVIALKELGADISYCENEGYPPLKTGVFIDSAIPTIRISGKISSQYLTGMLMALHLTRRQVSIQIYDELISKPYIDITIAILAKFGCEIDVTGNTYTITSKSNLRGIEYTIEPDASSASYFLALGAIKGIVTINNLSNNSLQGDRDFANVLSKMGANVRYLSNSIEVSANKLFPININMETMPDVAMTLAVMALFAKGTSKITGISSWKVKETNRILAMYNELTKLGALVEYTDDSITITPPEKIISNVEIDTYNDHRMAMCFSLVSAFGVPIIIKDKECVGKTFANYFEVFKELCY